MLLILALLVIPSGLAFASDATEGVAILFIGPIFGIFAGMNQASEGHVLTVTGTFRGCLNVGPASKNERRSLHAVSEETSGLSSSARRRAPQALLRHPSVLRYT